MPSASDLLDYEAYAASSLWDENLRRMGFVDAEHIFLGPDHAPCVMLRRRRFALVVWTHGHFLRFSFISMRSKSRCVSMAYHACELQHAMAYARQLMPTLRRLRGTTSSLSIQTDMVHAHTVMLAEGPLPADNVAGGGRVPRR